jgi:hypothetical protein
MTRDPIVDEVRANRDALAREHGYDIDRIFAFLREMEKRSGAERVRLPPRRHPVSPNADEPTVAADGTGTYRSGSPR